MSTAKLYHGDCMEILPTLADGSVDLCITSPPYNLGNEHHTANKRHNPYDDDMPEELYQAQQVYVLDELYRIISDGGSLFYNHKNRIREGIQISPYRWLDATRWTVKQEIVWVNGSPNMDRVRFFPFTERIYWLAKHPTTTLQNGMNLTDVFRWRAVGTAGEHTRAFPIALPNALIGCFPDADVVIDPYMGSGTVGESAIKAGRNFIGIEIERKYYDIAERRIKEAQMQPLLFGE